MKLNEQNQNSQKRCYEALTSADDIANGQEYMAALDWAIKQQDVHNVAISGPYGSGKSSVIRSYLDSHEDIKALPISLAAFNLDSMKVKLGDKEKEIDEKQLEIGILKQLFYSVDADRIPQSRYRKLQPEKKYKNILEGLLLEFLIFVPFDDRVNHQAEMSDLNITLIQNYLKEVKSSLYEKSKTEDFVEVCSDMNIISILPEYVKPKNIGLMFFSMEPDKFFPYTQIDVVQFPEGLGGNDIIENTFKGTIHQQLRDALQFIKNAIITEKVVKHPDRAEADRFFNYPYAAVEEALSNAVYHRAYDVREPIEVRVEQDRIEIVSFPGPDCNTGRVETIPCVKPKIQKSSYR